VSDWPFPAHSRRFPSLEARLADPAVQAGRAQALATMALRSRAPAISTPEAVQQIQRLQIDADMVERACRAHWPSFDRMRPDHAAAWRVKMQAALAAALYGGTLRP
jgi:hypothetical protein